MNHFMNCQKKVMIYSISVLALLLVSACQTHQPSVQAYRVSLDTPVQIRLDGSHASEKLIQQGFDMLDRFGDQVTMWKDSGPVYQLHQWGGKKAIKVPQSVLLMSEMAIRLNHQTGGLYDITIGPVVKAWNLEKIEEKKDPNVLPSHKKILELLKNTGTENIVINKKNQTIYLKKPHIWLDFGSIAKGYAADLLYTFFHQQGVQDGILNLGGNVYAMGSHNGHPWQIGIQNPYMYKNKSIEQGQVIGFFSMHDISLVTSGNYQRYFYHKNKMYSHILNRQTGYPIRSNVVSVTILGKSSFLCDGLSTCFFLLGIQKGIQFMKKYYPHMGFIAIDPDHHVYISSNVEHQFHLMDKSFHIKIINGTKPLLDKNHLDAHLLLP